MDEETKQAILYDSAYIAGLKAGYNLGLYEDHETLARHINQRIKDRVEAKQHAHTQRVTPNAKAPHESGA